MNIHNASDSGGGSLRDLLGRNIGRRASASFLVGSYRLVRQEGMPGGRGHGLSGAAAGGFLHRLRPVRPEIH